MNEAGGQSMDTSGEGLMVKRHSTKNMYINAGTHKQHICTSTSTKKNSRACGAICDFSRE
jgi:hypothetical protein